MVKGFIDGPDDATHVPFSESNALKSHASLIIWIHSAMVLVSASFLTSTLTSTKDREFSSMEEDVASVNHGGLISEPF
jgi:hypothetical protein